MKENQLLPLIYACASSICPGEWNNHTGILQRSSGVAAFRRSGLSTSSRILLSPGAMTGFARIFPAGLISEPWRSLTAHVQVILMLGTYVRQDMI
jgi:hypothetical protein